MQNRQLPNRREQESGREPVAHLSPARVWLLAVRPRTLPASVSTVMVGIAAAAADGLFAWGPAAAALAGAVLLQIGVNLANDYFDYQRGVDTDERLGPLRVTHSGLMKPQHVRRFMTGVFAAAALVGGYLTLVAGWPVVIIGCCSILAALGYSGGPYPLASHALGDAAVFIFFGPVAVCGTYYVQTLQPAASSAALLCARRSA